MNTYYICSYMTFFTKYFLCCIRKKKESETIDIDIKDIDDYLYNRSSR